MNFMEMQCAKREFDEIISIGKTLEKEGRFYHIAGMARSENKTALYIIEQNEQEAEACAGAEAHHYNNRAGMKIVPAQSYFDGVEAICLGAQRGKAEGAGEGFLTLETESVCSGPLAYDAGCDWESILLLAEMMKNGWRLPKDNPFATMDWQDIWLTKITFRTELEELPDWNDREVFIRFGRRSRAFYVEKPICLTVGQEMEVDFSIEAGHDGICYINKVYLLDVWKENEEKFKNPKYLEFMTKEELERQKGVFFEGLEQDCPRGMRYLGIEYECTLEGSIAFYDRDFLEAKPKVNKGSARVMMMLLKPDEKVGKHGLRQQGCVIQTPLAPDTKQIEAELFHFAKMLPAKEEILLS